MILINEINKLKLNQNIKLIGYKNHAEQFISQSNNISSKNSNSEDKNPLLKIQSNSVIYGHDNAIWPIKNDITSTSVIRKQVGSEVLTIPLIYKILQGQIFTENFFLKV